MTVVAPELREAQKAYKHASALRSVLQITDRALSGRADLTVNLVEDGPAKAWSDGERIYIARSTAAHVFQTQELNRALLIFKGLNYHELAHILFTPRTDDEITKWVFYQERQYRWAFNALEDQRIETLYTALYPATTPYFRNMILNHLLEDSVDPDTFYRTHSLLGGRRYVPQEVRDVARKAFVEHYGADVTDELDEIVQEYVALPLPGKTAVAKDLIRRFHELLGHNEEVTSYITSHQCGSGAKSGKGEVDPEKAVEAATRVLDDQENDEKPEPQQGGSGAPYPEDIQEDDDEEEYDDGYGGIEDDEDEEGGDSSPSQAPQQPQEAPQDKVDDSSSQTAGVGDTSEPGEAQEGTTKPEDLLDAVTDGIADVLTDEALNEDLERTAKSFKAHVNGKNTEALEEYTKFANVSPQPESVAAVKKIVTQLKSLRHDLEPGWERERPVGRLNTGGAIHNQIDPTFFDAFDQWDEGALDEATTEVVIMIDLSYSMVSVLPKCSEALWLLKRGFDKGDVRTTVLGFSNGNVVLYGPREKVGATELRQFQAWSGTEPRESLLYAHRALQASPATNRVLIAITDGVWGEPYTYGYDEDGNAELSYSDVKNENIVAGIRQLGAHTLQFGVNGHRTRNRTNGFEQNNDIDSIDDIVTVVRELVKNIQKKAAIR